jgi:hypothetical protein
MSRVAEVISKRVIEAYKRFHLQPVEGCWWYVNDDWRGCCGLTALFFDVHPGTVPDAQEDRTKLTRIILAEAVRRWFRQDQARQGFVRGFDDIVPLASCYKYSRSYIVWHEVGQACRRAINDDELTNLLLDLP